MLKLYPLLLLFLFTYAQGFQNKFQDFHIESAVVSSSIKGNIVNPNTIPATDFKNDLGFSNSYISQFSLGVNNSYKYLPNFSAGYLNFLENADANLTHDIEIADRTFTAGTRLQNKIQYNIVYLHLFHSMLLNSNQSNTLRKTLDSGEIEFKIGMSIQYVLYKYRLLKQNQSDTFIHAKYFIPLPYVGVTYYGYKLNLSANICALSLSRAKTVSSDFKIAYKIDPSLFITAGYMYESFHVTEDKDTITFAVYGPKIGFIYNF